MSYTFLTMKFLIKLWDQNYFSREKNANIWSITSHVILLYVSCGITNWGDDIWSNTSKHRVHFEIKY